MSRFMRVLVMFDLPTGTASERKEYTLFRKFLIGSGYDMLQYSVYSRIAQNRDEAEKIVFELRCCLPPRGQVRALLLTERQYSQMIILLGKPTVMESEVCDKELISL